MSVITKTADKESVWFFYKYLYLGKLKCHLAESSFLVFQIL